MSTKISTETASATLIADGFALIGECMAYLDTSRVKVLRYQSRGRATPAATGKMLRDDAKRRGDDVRDSRVTRYRDHGFVIVDVIL